jgi:CRP-like cAMP-binding protein
MGYELTQVGNPVDTLTFVINGGADVLKSGQTFSLPDGIFVGEIAYLTGHAASATVVLTGKSDVLEWNIPALRRQAARDVQFRLALDAMISLDLAGKVARGGSPVQV